MAAPPVDAPCTVEEAARRCCAAAGCDTFEAQGTWLRSSDTVVLAELPHHRNPGPNDAEWLCSVLLEGTPEDIGRQLAAIHAALSRPPPPPGEDAANFSGFTV